MCEYIKYLYIIYLFIYYILNTNILYILNIAYILCLVHGEIRKRKIKLKLLSPGWCGSVD